MITITLSFFARALIGNLEVTNLIITKKRLLIYELFQSNHIQTNSLKTISG